MEIGIVYGLDHVRIGKHGSLMTAQIAGHAQYLETTFNVKKLLASSWRQTIKIHLSGGDPAFSSLPF